MSKSLPGHYFDVNATTPLNERARVAWMDAVDENWHNPSSLYREAGRARQRLEDAREALAGMLGADPERLVFTSGATEANNAVFLRAVGTVAPDEGSSSCCLIGATEHPSVREAAFHWFGKSQVVEIPAGESGRVDPGEFRALLGEQPGRLVSVMAANNETGVIHPWRELLEICQDFGIPFHCDAAQWLGKLPAADLGKCDWLTGSAHKFGGPKGVGFLLIPEGEGQFAMQFGGPQERGRRAGTENLPAVVAMLTALEACEERIAGGTEAWIADRQWFEEEIAGRLAETLVVAPESERLWNTVMLVMPRHQNLKWLTRLSRAGFAVSTGSACSSGKENPSHVMEAMGLDYDQMSRVIRVSGGWDTTRTDWEALAAAFVEVAAEMDSGESPARGESGLSSWENLKL